MRARGGGSGGGGEDDAVKGGDGNSARAKHINQVNSAQEASAPMRGANSTREERAAAFRQNVRSDGERRWGGGEQQKPGDDGRGGGGSGRGTFVPQQVPIVYESQS